MKKINYCRDCMIWSRKNGGTCRCNGLETPPDHDICDAFEKRTPFLMRLNRLEDKLKTKQ